MSTNALEAYVYTRLRCNPCRLKGAPCGCDACTTHAVWVGVRGKEGRKSKWLDNRNPMHLESGRGGPQSGDKLKLLQSSTSLGAMCTQRRYIPRTMVGVTKEKM